MDLFVAALCMVLASLHQAIAFDRQYSALPVPPAWRDCNTRCRPAGSSLEDQLSLQLPESAVRAPAGLELSQPSAVAAPVGELSEWAAVRAPATPRQPEAAAAAATKRSDTSRYTHYPSRFQSEQYKVCRPSSGQIVKFLQALHEARTGKPNQLATLCSITRPVAGVDTNVRFVG